MKTLKLRYWDALAAKKDGKPLTITDMVIMLRSTLTHKELQFDENRHFVSFSSTIADNANGVRFKYITYSHPDRWKTLVLQVTDYEELSLWVWCCKQADLTVDWPIGGYNCSYTATAIIGNDLEVCKIKDVTIYQGPKHTQYDKLGLLSFALEKSKRWYLNFARLAIWGWTVIVKPSPTKVWCSEVCCQGINHMRLICGRYEKTEIDPQESYELTKQFKGVKEI